MLKKRIFFCGFLLFKADQGKEVKNGNDHNDSSITYEFLPCPVGKEEFDSERKELTIKTKEMR